MPHSRCLICSTPRCSRGDGHKLHDAACCVFSPSCPRKVSLQAVASYSCSPRARGAVGGTLGGSRSPACVITLGRGVFCLEFVEQQFCGTPLALLLCLESKSTLGMLAVGLGHGGVMGGWSSHPGKLCLLLLDKQRGSCTLAIKSWQHPPG